MGSLSADAVDNVVGSLTFYQIFATLAENVYWNNISFRFAKQPDLTPIYPKNPKICPQMDFVFWYRPTL